MSQPQPSLQPLSPSQNQQEHSNEPPGNEGAAENHDVTDFNQHSDNDQYMDDFVTFPLTMPHPNGTISPSQLHLSDDHYLTDPLVVPDQDLMDFFPHSSPAKNVQDTAPEDEDEEMAQPADGDVPPSESVNEGAAHTGEEVQPSASPMFIATMPPPTASEDVSDNAVEVVDVQHADLGNEVKGVGDEIGLASSQQHDVSRNVPTASVENDVDKEATSEVDQMSSQADVKTDEVLNDLTDIEPQHFTEQNSGLPTIIEEDSGVNEHVIETELPILKNIEAPVEETASSRKERKSIYEIPDSEDDQSMPLTSPIKLDERRAKDNETTAATTSVKGEMEVEMSRNGDPSIQEPQSMSQVQKDAIQQALSMTLERIQAPPARLLAEDTSMSTAGPEAEEHEQPVTATASSTNLESTAPTQATTTESPVMSMGKVADDINMPDVDLDSHLSLQPGSDGAQNNPLATPKASQTTSSQRSRSRDATAPEARRHSGRQTSTPSALADGFVSWKDLKKDGTAKKSSAVAASAQRSKSMDIPQASQSSTIAVSSPEATAPPDNRRHSGRRKSVPTGLAAQYVSWGNLKQDGSAKKTISSTPEPLPPADITFEQLPYGRKKSARKTPLIEAESVLDDDAGIVVEQEAVDVTVEDVNSVAPKTASKNVSRRRSGQRKAAPIGEAQKDENDSENETDVPMPDAMPTKKVTRDKANAPNRMDVDEKADEEIIEPNSAATAVKGNSSSSTTSTIVANDDTIAMAIDDQPSPAILPAKTVKRTKSAPKSSKRTHSHIDSAPDEERSAIEVTPTVTSHLQAGQTTISADLSSPLKEKIPEKDAIFAELKIIKIVCQFP
jgi:hypothetical protein